METFVCPHCGKDAEKIEGNCEWEGATSWCSACGRTIEVLHDSAPTRTVEE